MSAAVTPSASPVARPACPAGRGRAAAGRCGAPRRDSPAGRARRCWPSPRSPRPCTRGTSPAWISRRITRSRCSPCPESWKAFFYGGFDPAATITIDKLPGAFAVQALSARVFGFHPWSLALPQVAEGVVTVLAMYRAVRQWAGEVPGLLAALLLTLTPIRRRCSGTRWRTAR